MSTPEHNTLHWGQSEELALGSLALTLDALTVGSVHFEVCPVARRASEPNHFALAKSRSMVERYVALVAALPARRVVELGIYQGGSAAFLALLPEVEHLVAFELDKSPVASILGDFAQQQGLGSEFHMAFGVDQGDGGTIIGVLDQQGLDEIDLVTDDASHLYGPTLASFETLFPRLRPGGVYLIEDWRSAHVDVNLGPEFAARHDIPLTTLAFELVMACGTTPGSIASVEIDEDIVAVVRGPEAIDPDGFRLAALYSADAADLIGDWRD